MSPPPYKQLRFEEDYSYLRDRTTTEDLWDPLKYIHLDAAGDSYITIGGEVRPFFESFRNEEWGGVPGSNSYFLQRFMLHADVHVGKSIRFFGQVKSGLIASRRGGPRPPDKDALDVHQAFLEWSPQRDKKRGLSVRLGRQEMDFGSSRLISFREGPNIRQSFDGVRTTFRSSRWTIDGFLTKPVQTKPGVFDDGPVPGSTFWGAYAVGPLAPRAGVNVDVYYLGLDRKTARFEEGVGREIRHSVGARVWGRRGAIDYNFEAIYQLGTFNGGSIDAWTAASETGYVVESWPTKPRFALRADITSGDERAGDGKLGTFNPLFPKGAYFGLIAPVGPLNHRDLHPVAEFRVADNVNIAADWLLFWRDSRNDAVYGVPGNLVRTGQASDKRFVGHAPGVEASWQADRHTSVTVNYSVFFAGRFLKEAPPSRNIEFFAIWLTYKF